MANTYHAQAVRVATALGIDVDLYADEAVFTNGDLKATWDFEHRAIFAARIPDSAPLAVDVANTIGGLLWISYGD